MAAAAAAQSRLIARVAAAAGERLPRPSGEAARLLGLFGGTARSPGSSGETARLLGLSGGRLLGLSGGTARLPGPFAGKGRWYSSSSFQARRLTSSSSSSEENGNGKMKEIKLMFEFVKDLKEVFTAGTIHDELAQSKKLTTALDKLQERFNLLSNWFWIYVALVSSAALTATYVFSSQEKQVKDLTTDQKDLDKKVKELEKRVNALEYANTYAESLDNKGSTKWGELPKQSWRLPRPPHVTYGEAAVLRPGPRVSSGMWHRARGGWRKSALQLWWRARGKLWLTTGVTVNRRSGSWLKEVP